MITITESDMNFGPYEEEDVFYIENSKIYNKIKNKVKIAEFVLKKNNALIFIEAKSSVPNSNGKNPNGENKDDFDKYINEIVEKLNNSLDILLSAKLNILKDEYDELDNFINLNDLANLQIAFRLVVKKAEIEHLIPVQSAIEEKLASRISILKVTVKVINKETALKYKLIS